MDGFQDYKGRVEFLAGLTLERLLALGEPADRAENRAHYFLARASGRWFGFMLDEGVLFVDSLDETAATEHQEDSCPQVIVEGHVRIHDVYIRDGVVEIVLEGGRVQVTEDRTTSQMHFSHHATDRSP